MTTKETFCALIRSLQETKRHTDDLCDELYQVIQKHRPDQDMDLRGYQLWPLVCDTRLEDALIKELEKEFEDTEDSWISYFVYELEFGTVSYSGNCGNRPDGTPISLTTPEELYNFLIENIREKRSKEIFGTAVPNDKPSKTPYKKEIKYDNGTKIEIECFDYDGIEDKIALQLFTKLYFSECGEVIRGRSAENDLSVRAGDTVFCFDGKFYVVPRYVINPTGLKNAADAIRDPARVVKNS